MLLMFRYLSPLLVDAGFGGANLYQAGNIS